MRRDDLNSDIYTNVNISDEMVDSLVAASPSPACRDRPTTEP